MRLTDRGTDTTSMSGMAHLRRARTRLVASLTVMFAIAMAVAATADLPVEGQPALNTAVLVRLAVLGLVLPFAMAAVARLTLRPVEDLASAGSELQGLYSQARLDSLVDPLTRLGNHRAFQEELTRQIANSDRHDYPLALALLDFDDLKQVNDEHGHAVGDQLLGSLGRLIAMTIRTADRGFRIGGDEFAILLPHADAEAAHVVVRRLLASALNGDTITPGLPPFSFSAGVSAFPTSSNDASGLRRQADAALYWAKRHGRTDVQVFDAERHGAAGDSRSTSELGAAVAEVARTGAITAVYQPIFDMRTGEPIGFEGLVRPTADSGFADVVSLLLAAEAADRTIELDLACIDAVAAGARLEVPGQYLSINISPLTLEAEQFSVSELLARLNARGIEPNRVVLELTERETIHDVDRLRANLAACRAAGIRIAADDVGAGNAGLRLLSQLHFDIVKLDLSLVQGGVVMDSALAVLKALREMSERTQMTVVAEGIETREQLEVVRSLGLSAGQGYLLGLPRAESQANRIDLAQIAGPIMPDFLSYVA
jgi:diguanylate cyclase (GGDEF)-like protein